jgi:pyruvate carboxylase subunit A
MVGKLIVYALEWDGVVKKAMRALDEFFIDGIVTNISLHKAVVKDNDFKAGIFNTSYLEKKLPTFSFEANDASSRKKIIQDNSFILKGSEDILY